MATVASGPLHDMVLIMANNTLVCQNPHHITSKGIWTNDNPLHSSTPLLLLQLSVISIISRLIDLCLKPLGQSRTVSQIFGGLIFGPSLLGHGKATLASKLFPIRGSLMIEMIATFGLMFFFFAIGVKMDPIMMLRPERKALIIGFSVFFFTLILPNIACVILKTNLPLEASLANSLPFLATSQSITAFPVIACLLTELKILNTDLGRLALSSSMFCDAIGISLTAIVFSITGSKGGVLTTICSISSYFALMAIIAFTLRPAVLWMLNRIPEGKFIDETYIFAIFISVLVSGFLSEIIGQHFVLGPLIVGLAVPEGPPLGAALESRLDTLVSGLLYPTFLAVSGLKTNVFEIHFQAVWVVGIIVIFSCLVKIGAVILPAIYSDMPIQEAFVLGLVLNAKGINEIVVYNLWRESKILTDQEFALAVISVVLVTAIITPLVKLLYDPSKQYASIKRNTIQHVKRNAELRILVCIHNQDSVPTIINLLEVSHATEESPVAVIAVLLVELVGRTTPLLLAHQPSERSIERNVSRSGHIFNALQHYQIHNENSATVQSFTSMSHFEISHIDICQMAVDKRATIVILPFHKQWAIDGSVGSVNRTIQNMNLNVLDKAPCSVGILIDRGNLTGQSSILTCHSIYHVAVLFIGGADDTESLAYGARMAKHTSTKLTVIRFLLFGCENTRDRKHDSNLIDEFRQANIGNERFVYLEEVVKDGLGLATLIKGMENCFNLMIVGKDHQDSALLSGLEDWSECPELGVIGDMLASPDFGSTASVLVVQQQRVGENVISRPTQLLLMNERERERERERDQLVHDVGPDGSAAATMERDQDVAWTISINRYT